MDNQTDLLTPYRWKNRVLVVFSNDKESDSFKKQIQLFSESKDELKERDLIVFQVFKEGGIKKGITPNQKSISIFDIEQLEKRFDFSFESQSENKNENRFAVFLVGKDGGTKLKIENQILTIEKLFGTIDAMPMRQSEMREDRN